MDWIQKLYHDGNYTKGKDKEVAVEAPNEGTLKEEVGTILGTLKLCKLVGPSQIVKAKKLNHGNG